MVHLFVKGYENENDYGMFAHIPDEAAAREMAREFDPPLEESQWYTRPCLANCEEKD